MNKRFIIVIASMALAFAPFAFGIAAGGAAEWSELSATKSWQYDSYRVERLSETSTNLMKIGDSLVLVKRAKSCSGSCDLRDILILSNGGTYEVKDVQTDALDLVQIDKNEGRLVYAEFSNDEKTRINVIEVDLTSGQKITLVDDAFVTDMDEVMITVDDDLVYAQTTFSHSSSNDLYPQSTIFVWNPRYDKFLQLYHQWKLRYEELLDAEDGRALVRMTFPGGEEQLWVYDYVEFGEEEGTAVPSSWTPDVEDIATAHFASDDDVEFFRMYARNVADESLDETETFEQYLSWYRDYDLRDLRNIVQTFGDNMAWVDPENDLYVSNGERVAKIAYLGATGTFRLMEDRILWDNGSTGGLAKTSGISIKTFGFQPTDVLDDIVVGLNSTGEIVYQNIVSGEKITLGTGGTPWVSDERHVYWKGENAALFEATISLDEVVDSSVGTPIKIGSSPRVYLLTGNTIAYIPNEEIYYTWFESFANVVVVSSDQLDSYEQTDNIFYKPGTRIVINTGSKIYVIGNDQKLHWLVSEEIAEDLYGSDWDKNIISVSSRKLVDYGYGDNILTEEDLAKINFVVTE